MKETVTITKGDLTKALSVPWSNVTCVVAQAIMRVKKVKALHLCSCRVAKINKDDLPIWMNHESAKIQDRFDTVSLTIPEPANLKKNDRLLALVGRTFQISDERFEQKVKL